MKWLVLLLILTVNVFADEDTATSGNILPNAGTTSSNMDNFNLDGVNSGTGALTNNSTHNGFTITCPTQVNNACGTAFNGELEASYQMKVSADGTLVGIDGVEASTTYTTTQRKLDGGIQLNSYFSIQNCEDGNSSYSCGQSNGAEDTYKLHVKIKDAQGNTLAQMTTTRLEDAGYNANSRQFQDNLVYNGTGGASYEWYWEGYDGSLNTNTANLGPNLLGAELRLDFPIEDHEPLSTQEIEDINEALDTVDLTENEIYDIISGLESKIEEEFRLSGNLEEGTRLEINIENKEITFEVASRKTGAIVMESPMTAKIIEAMPIETLKEEMVAMVKEEMPFMEMIETVSTPSKEEPKAKVEETTTEKKTPGNTEPGPPTKMASTPQTSKEKTSVIEEKNEPEQNKESKEEEPTSESAATSTVQKSKVTKQKKVQSKKTIKPELAKVMAKVDDKVKNPLKNLQLKNLIKMDAMVENQLSLDSYNVAFYAPKDIYLEQLNLIDNRLIYADKTLATYTDNDIIGIKARKLGILNNKKNRY
eukprot:GHVU01040101.1.p1 GENE.GHVU01040101.1~~GHVU01040101.1.p1  ORF type:complete len:535 (+),score=72.69 GHVU01040101.1:1191-2795(+)